MVGKRNVLQDQTADENEYHHIFELLHEKTHIDFSAYKPATMSRRIQRRMLLNNTPDLDAYCTFLQSHPEEIDSLQKDLLINVTRFFREPEKFMQIEEVILPTLLSKRTPDAPLRVWVPGCATGEEAYSLAMTFTEFLSKQTIYIPIQIFATDINTEVIEKARQGWYPKNIAGQLTSKRLNRFFKKVDGGFQVNKEIRDLCIFAMHDVLQNPPFSHIDLISCQNLLIYVNQPAQKKILTYFHYALNTYGYLLLGNAENIGSAKTLFHALDSNHKIFIKQMNSMHTRQERQKNNKTSQKLISKKKAVMRVTKEMISTSVRKEKIQSLRETLALSQDYVNAIIDEINEMTKSLQSANEELIVNNEELQTANEELETSQEELQEANEALVKLNRVLQKREETVSRLASIVESSDDAIYSKNTEGVIISWNKGAERLYGYQANEVIGKQYTFLIPPGRENDFPKIMHMLKQGKRVEHHETHRITKDGRILAVSLTVSPLKNAQGEIIGASKIARDITNKKQIENNLQFLSEASIALASSLDYQTTLKRVGKLAITNIADWCMVYLLKENKAPEIIISAREAHIRKAVETYVLQFPTQPGGKTMIAQVMQTKKPLLIPNVTDTSINEMAINDKHKQALLRLNSRSAMTVPLMIRKEVIGAMMFQSTNISHRFDKFDFQVAQELAERAALAIENARLYTESQQALTLRDDFISIASHELKTPVTSLKIYTQMLKKQFQTNKQSTASQYLERMDSQLNSLNKLVHDLLDVSRLEHGELDFQKKEFNVNELVKETIESIQTTTRQEIVLEGVIQRNVFGDRFRIYQVLVNLLTNAIKYSPQSKKIIVRLSEEKKVAIVTIQDFGIGIDKKDQSNIFKRFYRVNAPVEKTYPGLGIGLYICSEIIGRHNGELHVTSAKGKGSLFSFTLPFHTA